MEGDRTTPDSHHLHLSGILGNVVPCDSGQGRRRAGNESIREVDPILETRKPVSKWPGQGCAASSVISTILDILVLWSPGKPEAAL